MINTFTQSFFLRKEYGTARNAHPVQFRAFINKKKVKLSTNLKCHIDNWDQVNQRFRYKGKSGLSKPMVDQMNLALEQIAQKAQAIFLDYQNRSEFLRPDQFKDEFQGKKKLAKSFSAYLDEQLEVHLTTVNDKTKKQYLTSIRAWNEFAGANVNFSDLTPTYIRKYEGFLQAKGLGPNTRQKRHKQIKIFISRAADEIGFRDPYQGFKLPSGKENRDYLLQAEVQRLIKLHSASSLKESDQDILSQYLFACHTGLRLADTNKVGPGNVDNGMLVYYPEKTEHINKRVYVPLPKNYMEYVVNKRGSRFFESKVGQYINRRLAVIAEQVGIRKHLTFHTARHTYATNFLAAGGAVEVLQNILAHSSIDTTMKYVHMTKDRIALEGANVNLFATI